MKAEIPQWIYDHLSQQGIGSGVEAIDFLLDVIAGLREEIETLRSGKPDWKDAPEWAEWLACDMNNTWWWYGAKPDQDPHSPQWMPSHGDGLPKAASAVRENKKWMESLEKRPTHENE